MLDERSLGEGRMVEADTAAYHGEELRWLGRELGTGRPAKDLRARAVNGHDLPAVQDGGRLRRGGPAVDLPERLHRRAILRRWNARSSSPAIATRESSGTRGPSASEITSPCRAPHRSRP